MPHLSRRNWRPPKMLGGGCFIPPGIAMRIPFALLVATAVAIALAWWWLGRPVALPSADPGGIPCLSYAPFRGDQSPLVASTHVEAWQIEEDLAKLARLTGCVRTYATDNGLDQVPAVAQRLGIKVLQGLWLGSDREKKPGPNPHTPAPAPRSPGV